MGGANVARILILGGGFAGVTAADVVSAGAGEKHEITLVSTSRRLTFFPALMPMVFGDFEAGDVNVDMVAPLRGRGVRFVGGEVLNIDPKARTVRIIGTDIDGDVHFDKLIIAMGRRLATEKIPGFFEYSHHLLGVNPARRFKNAIADFQKGSIVLGLCPEGRLPIPICESALALAGRFERQIADKTISITVVFPEAPDRALAGAGLFRDIERAFNAKGINLVSDFLANRVDKKLLFADDRPPIPFDLLMLIPPFCGQASIQHLYHDENSDGFARVNSKMQLEGFNGIYAAGDIISLPGPRFGYMAMRQAKVAAVNVLVELSGETASLEYNHEIEWVLGEKYTHPNFFHYGVWDNTLEDFDENALLGMAKRFRDHYGRVADAAHPSDLAAINFGGIAGK